MKKLRRWQLASFLVTALGGTLLHFLYDWSGQNSLVAAFSAVNESTWEHMKLFFVPAFVFSLAEAGALADDYPGYWCAKLSGIWIGLALIPWLYYSCLYGLGITARWLGPVIFYLAAAATCAAEYCRMRSPHRCSRQLPALLLLCVTAVLFVVSTYYPVRLPLFQDPVNGTYGIS